MRNTVDIAIYHTEADNKSGWVDTLSDFLKHYLEQKKVAPASIEQITFDKTKPIKAKLAFVILSNNTINLQEINVSGDTISAIKIADLPAVNMPAALNLDNTYQLFEKDNDSGKTATYSVNSSSDIQSLYWMKLLDIAYDTYHALHPNNLDSNKGKTIYIAETSPDQIKNRDKLKRELIRHGFTIVPSSPLPSESTALKQTIIQELDKCSLSIHLIGSSDATLNNESTHSKVEIQNDLAAQYVDKVAEKGGSAADFSRFLWISPDLQFTNEQQQDKVDQLKRDVEALKGAEVVQTPMEIFKSILLYRMSDNYKQEIIQEDKVDYTNSVYLIYDQFEFEKAQPIINHLKASEKTVLVPKFEGEQLDIINHHRKCLINCDSVLVVYHNNNPKWALSKVNDMRKSPGFGRTKPFISKAIYLDKPDENISQNKAVVDIIIGNGNFSPSDLNGFLSKLK